MDQKEYAFADLMNMGDMEFSEIDYPKISVVVPIRNEEDYIGATLRFILDQDYPREKLEVLVVDGCSSDRTVAIVTEIAAKDKRVRLLRNHKRLSSAARAMGAREANGDIVTFVDGHVYIDNDQLLKNTIHLLAQKNVSVLSRPQFLETPDNTRFQQAVALARRSIIGHGLDSTIYSDEDEYVDPTSSGASYKREVFDKIGYFDSRFDACEDVEFNFRAHQAGFDAFTSKDLAVYYYPRRNLGGLFRQMTRYGTGRFRLTRKHPEAVSIAAFLPALFVLGFFAFLILSIFSPLVGSMFSAAFGGYLALIFVWSAYLALKHSPKYLLYLLVIFPAIHFGLGWGYLKEAFRTAAGRGIDFSDKTP